MMALILGIILLACLAYLVIRGWVSLGRIWLAVRSGEPWERATVAEWREHWWPAWPRRQA